MDKFWIAIITALAVLMPSYACYRVGRSMERKALTSYLVKTLDDECNECHAIGYSQARHKYEDECDTDAPDSGRY